MRTAPLLCIASILVATSVQARDQGVINQTGVYERSMAVYLHPAGYFFEQQIVAAAPVRNTDHPAVAARRAVQPAQTQAWSHPALRRSVSRSLIAGTGE